MRPTPKLTEHQLEEIEHAPVLYRGILKRAYQGKASPREAIKAMCLMCHGYEDRERITDCTAYACALHAFRPYQRAQDAQMARDKGLEVAEGATLDKEEGSG